MTREINGYYPAGEYTMMYEGTGVITVGFDAEDAIFTEAGTYSVSVNPGGGGIHLTIRESDVNDPVRNIRMIMPGYESIFETEPFYPAFLQRLESFEGIRMLNLQNINITSGNQTQFWSQRKPKSYVTQCPNTGIDSGNIDGMAFEWLIELANTTGNPPWFCIPHKVDDNYVIQLALLLRDNLEPELKIYIEYSNELWNWTYWDQVQYVEEQGLALELSDDPYLAGLYYQAKRSAEIFQIFGNEFEDLSRLVRVISGQAGNPWVAQMLLEGLSEPTINPLGFNADALAIAPYFGGGIADYIGDEGLIESITVDEILDIIEFGVPGHITEFEMVADLTTQHKVIAENKGIDLIAYEGGQHLVAVNWEYMENETLTQKLISANRSPRIKELYTTYLETWFNNGGGLMMAYNYTMMPSMYGSWGALEYMDQSYDEAYKYQALAEYNTASVHGEKIHPLSFDLLPAFPNPFNPVTTLRYDLPEDAVVNVTIYDIMGRVVRTLVNSQQNAGFKSIQWNATNNAGQPVSAGLYLYTIKGRAVQAD
jgi:hypothetical protein